MNGVEKLIRRGLVDFLAVKSYDVGNGLACLSVEKTPNRLKSGSGDFAGIVAYLNSRDKLSVLFDCRKLVNAV